MSKPTELLAEKMLQGWTMLGEHCPQCNSPLMVDRRNNGQEMCVVCGIKCVKEQEVVEKAEVLAPPEALKRDPSSLLGEKLLEGWTMLAESCEDCHCPLMRPRGGEQTCVVCADVKPVAPPKPPVSAVKEAPVVPVAAPARVVAADAEIGGFGKRVMAGLKRSLLMKLQMAQQDLLAAESPEACLAILKVIQSSLDLYNSIS